MRRSPPTAEAPVLVGFDGAEGGRDALELGRVLGSVRGTRYTVAIPDDEHLAEEAREALEDPQTEIDIDMIGILSPATMLVECAERAGAGTLVVGSTRRGKIGRALVGSTAEQVLHKAPCEVVVAPRGYASEHHDGLAKIAVADALAEACEPDVDLLVAGSRRPWDRFLLGSVTKHLIAAAPCPVLVVPQVR